MKFTMIVVAGLAAFTISNANANSKLPKEFLGEWCFRAETGTYHRERCRENDGWMNVRPTGFSAHEMACTLQGASPNRSGEYRARFKCQGEGTRWTAYYWIGLDARDLRHMFMDETDSTFTKTIQEEGH